MKKITLLLVILLMTVIANATVTKTYAVTDIVALQADLTSGAADIYQLTTPGGNYQLTTTAALGIVFTKSITIQAAANLYAKPIISVSYNGSSATASLFSTNTVNLTFNFQNIELNGANTYPSATGQTMLFYGGTVATNTAVIVSNCYIHNFLNQSGNGTIRLDAGSGSSMDVENTTFNFCSGRILYFAVNTTSGTKYGNALVKNCTVANIQTNSINPSSFLFYKSGVTYGGTATVDHCTFYKCSGLGNEIFTFRSGGVSTPYMTSITISNNIFDQIPLTLTSVASPAYQIKNCYLAGLASTPPTTYAVITNTQGDGTTLYPTYINPLILDFTLTNKSSFTDSNPSPGIGDMTYYNNTFPALLTPTKPANGVPVSPLSFTADWTASVTGDASAYMVYVYNSTQTALVKSILVSGQTNTTITGLTGGTTYYYTVKELSTGVSNSNSLESPYSNAVTTPSPIQLTTPDLSSASASAISAESFSANWTSQSTATNYTVKVYNAALTVVKTVVTPTQFGGTLSMINITGLTLNTPYTYTVTAMGDGISTLTSAESNKSSAVTTLSSYPSSINTNFADGTWGGVLSSVPVNLAFPTYSINGFDLLASALTTNIILGAKGEVHTNRISLDKLSATASITLPIISTVAEIEIHYVLGTAGNSINLKIYNTGTSTWDAVGTYTYDAAFKLEGTDQIILVSNATPLTNAKYRIENNSTGACYITQIITRATASLPALAAPAGTLYSSNTSSAGFTATWTNTVASAVGYKVNVYSNKTKALSSSTTVLNGSALSLSITGLQADSTYLYGVAGLGDGSTNSDGYILIANNATTTTPVITNMASPVVNAGGSNPTATGFTANWAAVNNASSYDVRVYQGASLISTTNASGQATTSLAITGLSGNTVYTYTVTAKGNGTSHFDSSASASSASITTLSLPTVTTQAVTGITFSSATGNGNITVLGNPTPTQYGHCWNTSPGVTISNSNTTLGAASATGAFTSSMTGLASSTTYYVNVYATNTVGTAYGTEVSFSTPTASTDYFRSTTTGNWSDASSWQSSYDNVKWVSATSAPTSSATGITILNGHTITLTSGTLTTALTVSLGGVLKTGGNTLTNSGTVTINGSFQIDEGSWATGNDFVYSSTGALIFNNTGSSYGVSSNAAYWPYTNGPTNVTVGTAGITLNAWRTVEGLFQTASGVTIPGGQKLTINGQLQVNTGGYISTNSPEYGTSSRLIYNNGGDYSTNLEWPSANAPANVTIQASGTNVTTNANKTISGDLTISSGAALNIAAGTQLTVSTTMTNNGTLNLLSTSADGTATIITPATLGGSGGTYNVNQYMTTGRNWYISSPVASAATGIVTAGSAGSLWSYDEPSTGWLTIDATHNDASFVPTKGYVAEMTSDGAVTFTGGALNAGDIQTPVLSRTGTAKNGFNLIGNPYPSYASWNDATKTKVLSSIWYRSKSTGSYVFQTYNSYDQEGTLGGSELIPPMQAFWVRTDVDQPGDASVTFKNGTRSHQNQTTTTGRLKAPAVANAIQQVLRLQVSNEANSDEAIVVFNPNASDGLDAYDSPKMSNNNVAIPEIYTTVGNEKLVINGMNSIAPDSEIPLGFTTGQSNTFTIKATEVTNFDAGTQIVLKDNLLNTEQDLTDGTPYTFASDVASTTSRFSVVFKSVAISTGVQAASGDKSISIYKNANNQITVNYTGPISDNGFISVYNAVGQKLEFKKMTGTTTIIDKAFTSGVYVVTVNNGGTSTTKKVILN